MMKKILKVLGVLAIGGFAIGLVWYFQALKVDGDPLLTACWAVDIYDDVTGEKVIGAEDLDFDPETGTVFLSAYDRRAVAREIDEGNVTTQGGIYTFQVSDITESGTLSVTDISSSYKEGRSVFRPHGISLGGSGEQNYLFVINREVGGSIEIKTFENVQDKLRLFEVKEAGGSCDPNDLVFWRQQILYTDSTLKCDWGLKGRIQWYIQIVMVPDKHEKHIIPGKYFNGVSLWQDNSLVVADTLNAAILFVDPMTENFAVTDKINLSIAPDNLTVDEKDNLYVAGFPNFINYFFYMKSWFGVKKSPSAAYRISPDDYRQDLLFKDDGSMISGATVALRAGDYLILGSGWDDNIAICSGMDGLD